MSDCACLYGDYDGYNEFYSDAFVTARKTHKCCECRREIRPGERYHRATGKSDGVVWTYKTCAVCQEIRAALYCGSVWIFTQLWEDVQDQLFSEFGLSVNCIDKLSTVAAKTYLQQRYQEYLGVN